MKITILNYHGIDYQKELEKHITELLIDGTNGRIEIIQSDILDFAIHKKEVLLL